MRARDYPRRNATTPAARAAQPTRARLAFGALCVASVLLGAGCGGSPTRPDPPRLAVPARLHPPPADAQASNEVLIRAIGLVGTPYRHGGNTPAGGFDCSGLVGYVFGDAANRAMPRTTAGLVTMRAPAVGALELEPGDLVFFSPGGGAASHIGIFVGEGRFVHAPSSGGTVRLDRLDVDYWRRSFVAARRILF